MKLRNFYKDIKNPEKIIQNKYITERGDPWINIFSYYTGGKNIWPRGLPLSKINKKNNFSFKKTDITPSIMWNGRRGARRRCIYRLTHKKVNQNEIKWKMKH